MTTTLPTATSALEFYSRDQVAEMLGVAPLTLSRWVAARRIGAYRIARRLRFSAEQIRAYLARHETRERS